MVRPFLQQFGVARPTGATFRDRTDDETMVYRSPPSVERCFASAVGDGVTRITRVDVETTDDD